MKQRIFLLSIALFFALNTKAQENTHKFDFKVGYGYGFLMMPVMYTFGIENELNFKLNNYFSTSISIGYGKSDHGVDIHSDYVIGSANIFISPFKNNKSNNFKIGSGYSFFNLTDIYLLDGWSEYYSYFSGTVGGFNVIFEDEQMIFSKFLIGVNVSFLNISHYYSPNFINCSVKLGILL